MGRYCRSVRALQMGGIQSFPFMFDCDSSGIIGLRDLSLIATPLQSASLHTLPLSIRHFQLIQMDTLRRDELFSFLERHSKIITLTIRRCKHINTKFAQLIEQLPHLKELGLYGHEVNDLGLQGFFDIPTTLHSLEFVIPKSVIPL